MRTAAILLLVAAVLIGCDEVGPSVERRAGIAPAVARDLTAYLDRSPDWCVSCAHVRVGSDDIAALYAYCVDARVHGDAAACEPAKLPGAAGGVTCSVDRATGAYLLRASIGSHDGRAVRAEAAFGELARIHATLRVNVPGLPAWEQTEEGRFGTGRDRGATFWGLMLLAVVLTVGFSIALFVRIGLAAARRSDALDPRPRPRPHPRPTDRHAPPPRADAAEYPSAHGDDGSADLPPG